MNCRKQLQSLGCACRPYCGQYVVWLTGPDTSFILGEGITPVLAWLDAWYGTLRGASNV